ncbi:MAG: DNA polymerase, partial [Bacteroidota bacterium]
RVLFSGPKKTHKTVFRSGNYIQTSPDHLFRTYGEDGFRWVPQSELKPGMWVATSSEDDIQRSHPEYGKDEVIEVISSSEEIDMYDMQLFDDDHAFVCDGFIVHNSSADITKLSMVYAYKECKKRGWLDRCQMVVTMHDELCFQIDPEILEEALEMLNDCMLNNTALKKLNWRIPLASDVELGYDWSVPWNIADYLHKGKEWPEELRPWFPKATERQSKDPKNVEHASEGKSKSKSDHKKILYKGEYTEKDLNHLALLLESCFDLEGEMIMLYSVLKEPIMHGPVPVDYDKFIEQKRLAGL